MNDFILSALLGVVEGITEFIPVSSTAHLRIAQHLLGISLENEFWKLFAIFIQLGAILAVPLIFRQRLADFLRTAPALLHKDRRTILRHPFVLIGMAFVCTAGPAFILKKVIGQNLESLTVMMLALAIGGVIMILVDKLAGEGRVKSVEQMAPWQAIFIGFCQVLSAVFPGTSRSMSTIASGQIAGLSRSAALDFSFLLSIPVMIVATLYDLYKYMKTAPAGLSAHELVVLAIGTLISFVVSYVVIVWFLGYVRKHGLTIFGIYRIILAACLFFFARSA
jgi:undecaprenyl-diphosphatase